MNGDDDRNFGVFNANYLCLSNNQRQQQVMAHLCDTKQKTVKKPPPSKKYEKISRMPSINEFYFVQIIQ